MMMVVVGLKFWDCVDDVDSCIRFDWIPIVDASVFLFIMCGCRHSNKVEEKIRDVYLIMCCEIRHVCCIRRYIFLLFL